MTLTVIQGGRSDSAPRQPRAGRVCAECRAVLFSGVTVKHHGRVFCDPLCAASYDQRARLNGERP